MLDKLERSFLGRLAIPHLTMFLVAGQAGAWILSRVKPEFGAGLVLVPALVLRGEVWRVLTFLFVPPPSGGFLGDIAVIFALLLLFIFGRALEAHWGHFRFNAFMFVGWLASVAASFAQPYSPATNLFLMESVFLAFAYLNPNYELLLFFVLPVKVKWLALLMWLYFAYAVVTGLLMSLWQVPALVGAGVLNFFLFLGGDIARRARGARHTQARVREVKRAETTATHRCEVCGVTDLSDPQMQFRYCSQCEGQRGYCSAHLRDHEHVREA